MESRGVSWLLSSLSQIYVNCSVRFVLFEAEVGLSLMTVGAVLLERTEASVFVELELQPLPVRPWVDL